MSICDAGISVGGYICHNASVSKYYVFERQRATNSLPPSPFADLLPKGPEELWSKSRTFDSTQISIYCSQIQLLSPLQLPSRVCISRALDSRVQAGNRTLSLAVWDMHMLTIRLSACCTQEKSCFISSETEMRGASPGWPLLTLPSGFHFSFLIKLFKSTSFSRKLYNIPLAEDFRTLKKQQLLCSTELCLRLVLNSRFCFSTYQCTFPLTDAHYIII